VSDGLLVAGFCAPPGSVDLVGWVGLPGLPLFPCLLVTSVVGLVGAAVVRFLPFASVEALFRVEDGTVVPDEAGDGATGSATVVVGAGSPAGAVVGVATGAGDDGLET
jgi:hypothetical protein